MTLQRKLLAMLIAGAFGIGPALAQDAETPPPDEQTPPPAETTPEDAMEAVETETATPDVPTRRLTERHADALGSEENAFSLVTALRTGQSATLNQETVAEDGTSTLTSVEFQPATGPMGFGEIDHALALAEADLADAGIADPTPEQFAAALNGGAMVDAEGNTVEFSGVLQLRSEGMGWGQIAHTLGVKLGEVERADRANAAVAAGTERRPEYLTAARIDRPERLDRPAKPERPEGPERPDRGGRPGG